MSHSSCTRCTFQAALRRLNVPTSARRSTGNASLLVRVGPHVPSHITSWLRYWTTQQRSFQSQTPLLFDGDQTGSQSFKQSVLPPEQKLESSGIGPTGQQTKDLQEHVSSMTAALEGSRSLKNAPQKKSRSTPARLARRERRMPTRRFKGDRTRPEAKEPVSSKAASKREEKGFRRVKGAPSKATSERVEKKPQRAEIVDEAPGRESSSMKTASKEKNHSLEHEQAESHIQPWSIQKRALKEKFGAQGWMPRKRLSPDALEGIRTLHAQYPETYTTPILAEHFKVSPEAIRRILKSKWRPSELEEDERKRRWEKRGESIWKEMNEKGVKPPKKWRQKGIGRLAERKGKGKGKGHRSVTLEEKIGPESDPGVITTRAVGEQRKHESLATKIL